MSDFTKARNEGSAKFYDIKITKTLYKYNQDEIVALLNSLRVPPPCKFSFQVDKNVLTLNLDNGVKQISGPITLSEKYMFFKSEYDSYFQGAVTTRSEGIGTVGLSFKMKDGELLSIEMDKFIGPYEPAIKCPAAL